IDPFCKENQREWLEFLAKRGFLPDQFKLLAKMNEKEGGAEQILIIKKLEQFMDLALTPLIDSDAVSNLPAVIEEHRDRLKQEPQKRKEKELVELLHKRFADLKVPAEQYVTLIAQEQENRLARQQLALRIVQTEKNLRGQQKRSAEEREQLKRTWRGEQFRIKSLTAEQRWLRKEELRLICEEKTNEYERARQALKEAEEVFALHTAAQKLAELRDMESACAALEAEIRRANAPAEQLAERLHAIGSAYRQVLTGKHETAAKELAAQYNKQNELQAAQAAAQTNVGGTQTEIRQLEADIEKLRQWFAESDAKQQDLYEQDILRPDEQAAETLARLNEEDGRWLGVGLWTN
ncbi:MAG: hypothetical protein GY862_00695, partial [Gammaproteobacteria bacterium]|nr:hypothetical protein [Gammaproteobacteria bacterium]